MSRVAHCSCGALRAELSGEPVSVNLCHCKECQRRTGSVFGVSAVFDKAQFKVTGPSKLYIRDGQEGRKIKLHFCPECGTTVYAEPDARPGQVVIAAGTFADPDFPGPTRSIWEESRHSWVAFRGEVAHFPQAAPYPNAPTAS